jgi:Ricin-type beta-trefoil lectin domain-like
MSILDAHQTPDHPGLGRRLSRRAALTGALLVLGAMGGAVGAGNALAQSSVNGQSVLGTASEPYVCLTESCTNPWNVSGAVQRVPSNTPATGQQFIITNAQDGKVIDDPNFNMNQGTAMDLWGENDGDNQKWQGVPSTGGYMTIVNRESGLCLDVYGAETNPGAPVIQWTCTGNANQQWKESVGVTENADGVTSYLYVFTNENSGLYLAATADGTGVTQEPWGSGNAVLWSTKKAAYSFVTTPANSPIEGLGVYEANGTEEFSAGGTDDLVYTCTSGYHFRMSNDTYYHSSTGDSQAALTPVGPSYSGLSTEPWESQASSEQSFAESSSAMTATDAIVVDGGTQINGVSYYADWGLVGPPTDGGLGWSQASLICDPN